MEDRKGRLRGQEKERGGGREMLQFMPCSLPALALSPSYYFTPPPPPCLALPCPGAACVCITTFTMVAFSGQRAEESERVMRELTSREWGLLLMDEVHVVPAQMFRKVRGGSIVTRGAHSLPPSP